MKKVFVCAAVILGIFAFCNVYIAQLVLPLTSMLSLICLAAYFIGDAQERRFERLKRNNADSVEFYGDKVRFIMEDKSVINAGRNEVCRIVEHKSDMGYNFYFKDGKTVYCDFGKNIFTKKDIRDVVKQSNFPNAKFEIAA